MIADIISLGHALKVVVPEGAAAELRRLTHTRERELKTQTADKNRLQHLMFIIFPEFLNILDVLTKSALNLIKHHPAPEDIVMRKLLYYAAVNTIKSHGIMHDKYQQMLTTFIRSIYNSPLSP